MVRMEAAITSLANHYGDFLKENRANNDLLWTAIKEQGIQHSQSIKEQGIQHSQAIKEQGIQLQSAVEKISDQGKISWSAICTTIAVLVAMIGAGAKVSHMLMESRIAQLEKVEAVRTHYTDKEIDRLREELNSKQRNK